MFVAFREQGKSMVPPSTLSYSLSVFAPLCKIQVSSPNSLSTFGASSAFGWCQPLFLAKAHHKKPQALKHAKNNIQWEQRTREKKRQPRLKYNKQQLREHLPKWPKPQDNSLCGSLYGCCCFDHLWLPLLITLPMALELVCWPACNVYIHRRRS